MASPNEFENHCWKDVYSAEDLKSAAKFARRTYVGEDSALLLVDLYNFVYDGGNRPVREIEDEFPGTCGEYAWAAIEPTKRLIAAARRAAVPIIYLTRHLNPNGIASTARGFPKARSTLTAKSYAIRDDFAPQPGDLIIYKERASGFYGTPMIAYLNRLRVRSLVICGESTSGCLRNTVQDAYMNNYHVSVPEECAFDRNLLSHKVNLFDMHHKYADVMHVEEIVAHFNAMATPGLVKAAGE